MTTALDHRADLRLALAAQRAGRLAEAEAAYRRVLEAEPDNADAMHLLGVLCQQTGKDDDALRLLSRAVELDGSAAHFHANLGSLLGKLGRTAEAVDCFERALRLRVDYPEAWLNLGVALGRLNRLADSADALKEAVRLREAYAEARQHLGDALRKLGEPVEALRHYRRAAELRPEAVGPLVGVAGACGELGLLAEATDAHRKIKELKPNSPTAASDYLHLLHYDPDVSRGALREEAVRWAERFAEPVTKSLAAGHGSTVLAEVSSLVTHDPAADGEPLATDHGQRTTDRLLRIGFFSADFREHPVSRLAEPILRHLDRSRFTTFCYSDVRHPDELTARIKAAADTWRETAGISDEKLAALIRQDRIDILVDLAGHMGGHRLTMFARKPAPVQVTHFNYPDTTGMSAMDWRVSDDLAEPQGAEDPHERYSVEKLLRLPKRAWCYQPTLDGPGVGPLPALRNGYFTFCSLNKPLKHSAPCVSLWAGVLRAVPTSKLMLLGFEEAGQNEPMARQFAGHGIGAERLRFVTRRPRRQFLDLFNQADLGLDPFPYNGGVTSCDSLWMGVPFVALEGNSYLSRQGLMLLSNVGLPMLVAKDERQYVRIAEQMAGKADWLAKARLKVRQRFALSPVCDGRGFARDLGEALVAAWRSQLL